MYTILINDDKSLTTSVKEQLIGDNTNTIQFLCKPPIVSDDPSTEIIYSADLCYEICGVPKGDVLITDSELYKGKVRFTLPSSAHFWNNRGLVKVWVNVVIEIITTVINPDTGEVDVERNTEYIVTIPTEVFIEEINGRFRCPLQKNPNTIVLTRGDSRDVKIALYDSDGYPYIPVEGDIIWFTLKKTAKSEDILVQKSIDPDTLTVSFVEADTRDLTFGEYRYEVELVVQTSEHYTVIKNTPFIITEELH